MEKVEIVVTATDSASQVLRGITSQFGELGNIIQGVTGGRALEFLTGEVIKFGKESVQAFTDSAMAAKQLSRLSGESIENSSRFIQVLDDFGLKQEDALAATRALTKQGLEPNIATLAKLSDQYREIKDPQEKNEFILKNLGRAGLQWAQVLEQGSTALNAHAAAINKNLIITEDMWEKAEKLRVAQDDLNDSIEGTKILVGSELVPALTDAISVMNADIQATLGWKDAVLEMLRGGQSLNDWAAGIINSTGPSFMRTTNDIANSQQNLGDVTQKTSEELKAEQEAVNALTKQNEDYLSQIGNLTDTLQSYDEKHKQIQDDLNAGKITLQEAQQKWQELADEQERASRRMILNMLQQQLAVDGLSSAETNYLLDLGLKWGVYSQSAVNQARAAQEEVNRLSAAFQNVPTEKTSVINVITNYQQIGEPSPTGGTAFGGPNKKKAGGGDVLAGMLYQVNETRTEYFQPAMNGTVIPLGSGGGSGTNFTLVYSPMVSLADKAELETRLKPAVYEVIRKAKADKVI